MVFAYTNRGVKLQENVDLRWLKPTFQYILVVLVYFSHDYRSWWICCSVETLFSRQGPIPSQAGVWSFEVTSVLTYCDRQTSGSHMFTQTLLSIYSIHQYTSLLWNTLNLHDHHDFECMFIRNAFCDQEPTLGWNSFLAGGSSISPDLGWTPTFLDCPYLRMSARLFRE